jgi:hypothetical protein
VEHDLFGKPVSTFPDHALGIALFRAKSDFAGSRLFAGSHNPSCSNKNAPLQAKGVGYGDDPQ